ncbi:zinc finger and SCAN domain-containing protein 12 isoform X2 [Ooceraea biroi]|uniref:zinc finger and SCAN domain-containing protein 12 isoform X2 n=1 Tax=Ooceraea biroi TaxID=2015173 RepID=UPI0005BB1A2C|nr:zinc finger and SCAN domain-containing protein 12 isoform X2 [Ooceraea biroi]
MMTLRLFDSQGYSTVDAVPNMCVETGEMESCDYLRDCINNFENKDSRINLPATSMGTLATSLEGSNLEDVNLINIDFNFMKIENMFVQNTEESENIRSKREEKQEKSMDINISGLIENLDKTSRSCNTFSNFWRGESYGVTKLVNNDDNNEDVDLNANKDNCTSENVASELKLGTKIDNQLADEVQKCEQCLMTFRYKRHLDRHLEGHQKNNCPHCNEKFARRKHLAVHLFRAHGERMVRYPHSCDVCTKSFPKRALLNRHRAKHSYENGKVCSECGDMINICEKEHKENQCRKRRFTCQQCSQAFSIEQTYLSHIQNHNNYKCPNCNIGFASKRKAHEHLRTVHTAKLDDSDNSTNSGPYFCTDCRHTFAKKDDYVQHLESALHLSKIDNRDIPIRTVFTCKICSKSLVTQRALDQHVRRIHRGKKHFVCNVYECTFQCARKTDLNRHKQLHVEKRNIVCEYCGKTFTSISILKDHVLYIHSKERQFICEKCGKTFKRNSLLKRHKLSHEQHRPFVCTHCSTAFKRSHHLTRHLEACHRITLERKKKMVKLMKTEDGHLVPVPEKSKTLKSRKVETIEQSRKENKVENEIALNVEKDCLLRNIDEKVASVDSQLQIQSSSSENLECPNVSLEFTNLPVDSIPQVFSIVDVNTGQVLTVEVANPELLTNNELTDQCETNCSEMLNLPYYQDIDFQTNLQNADETYYDNTNYAEASLEGSLSFMNSNNKLETIESYLTHGFPPFLNI